MLNSRSPGTRTMQKRRPVLFLYILTVILAVGAVGCERALPLPAEPTPLPQTVLSPAAPTPTLVTPAGQQLILWHTLSGPAELAVQEIVDTFNRDNEWGITITVEAVATLSDLEANLAAAIQAGQLPDLLIVPDAALPELLAMQAVAQDVANVVQDEEWRLTSDVESDLYLAAFPTGDVVDHRGYVAVPMSLDVLALIYSPATLRQAGIEEPPRTWDEFEAACRAFQKEREKPCLALQPRAEVILNIAWALGSLYQRAEEVPPQADEGLLLTATLLRALADNGAIVPQSTPAEVVQAALEGEVAFGVEFTSALAPAAAAWAVAPLPTLSEKPVMLSSSPLLVMLATHDAGRQVASWLFIRAYLGSPESQALFATATDALPIGRRAARQLRTSADWPAPLQALLPWLSTAHARPIVPEWAAVSLVVEEVAVKLLNREITPQEAVELVSGGTAP